MSARIPKPGYLLNCPEGSAVVVDSGDSPLDGLLTLLEEEYGGDRFAADNPAVVAALSSVRICTWVSCSKAWRDEYCNDPYSDEWWSEDGDGKRSITVAWFDGDVYLLGDEASDAAEGGESNA